MTLVAVSKTKPWSAVAEAWHAGARDFGENYVQELTQKCISHAEAAEEMPLRWHMIGHLQKNKVKYLIGQVALIHSVDSIPLAEQIEKEAAKKKSDVNILLEVNVSREESKWGFEAADVIPAAEAIRGLPHLRLLGLMTSAPFTEDPESNRKYFRALANLARELDARGLIAEAPEGIRTPALSMGMSCDYQVAVEEGATLVRVGTDIFGARNYGTENA